MMFRTQTLPWIVGMTAGIILALPGSGSANELDSALRGGDMSKVLDLLGTNALEETVQPGGGAVAEIETADTDEMGIHRIPLTTPGRAELTAENSSRTASQRTIRSGQGRVPVPVDEAPATAADTGQPRKALQITPPAEVPLIRPRRVVDPDDLPESEDGADTSYVTATVSPQETNSQEEQEGQGTPAVAPEDRNQAAAELVKLLKAMDAPAPPPKAVAADTTAKGSPPPDEDQDRSKPLGKSTFPPPTAQPKIVSESSATDRTSAAVSMAPRDLVQQTRTDLEGLLREAKSDAFGDAASAMPPAQGSVPRTGWRYDGQWRNGHMDGFGVLSYPDGWTYEGQWQEGRVIGTGTLTHPDGWQYTGEWRDGRMDGVGTLTYPDGWRYVGEWRDGKMHGKGELIHPDG